MLTSWGGGQAAAQRTAKGRNSSNSSSHNSRPHAARPCSIARLGPQATGTQAPGYPASQLHHTLSRHLGRKPRHSPISAAAAAAAAAAATPASTAPPGLRGLYPQLAAHANGYMKVSEQHTLYYEVYGNPKGTPAVVVHGGPGAGCWPNHARFFDPAHYRIILVDQRGCGRSTPYGCLAGNTTAELVGDLEQLRRALGVQQWVMLGGSWGVTLALAYVQAFPASVLGIVLRGVCLMRPQEIHWMFGGGAAALKPLGWTRFLQPLSAQERTNPLLAYYRRMLSADAGVRAEAAKSWSAWEMSVGFSNAQNVVVWDGQQWGEQASPALPAAQPQQQQQAGRQQRLPPPPKPVGQGAVNAATAAAGGLMPLLHRDLTGSSWCSTLQQRQQLNNCTTSTVSSASVRAAAAGAGQQCSTSSIDGLHRPILPRRDGGTNCTSSTQQEGLSDGADLQLIERGLQHRGFKEHGHAQALLEAHYSVHGAFLQQQPLLEHIDRVRHIPCIAVQGQWDLVCPPSTAVELGQAWPEMELRLVPRAGHSMYDPAITHELVTATDRMRVLQQPAAAEPAEQASMATSLLMAAVR